MNKTMASSRRMLSTLNQDEVQKFQSIGKMHALKKYDQFTQNTSCFWDQIYVTPVVKFHEIFVTKIMNKLIYQIVE